MRRAWPAIYGLCRAMMGAMQLQSLGILGLGSFGRFVATLCPADMSVLGYDAQPHDIPDSITQASFEEVAQCDVVLLAVPLGAYETVLTRLAPLLLPETLLVDICSVKTAPEQLLARHLPTHRNLLVTHPLFGPQSAASRTKGHTLIVTQSQGARANSLLDYCDDTLRLRIVRMSSQEHDKTMATVHALTFFVARTLDTMDLPRDLAVTPSYQALLDLTDLDKAHSQELFETVETGNPYARETVYDFIKTAETLATSLHQK